MESVQSQTPSKPHPADWDADDAALERAPQKTSPDRAPKLDNTHIQLTCGKCNYKIKYDVYKEQPGNCPYCGREIDKSQVRY
jgi:rubrerythrin